MIAEALLKQEEKKPQYSLQLLKIVAGQNFAVTTRLAAALAFKNYVRLNYVVRSNHLKLVSYEYQFPGTILTDLTYRTKRGTTSCPPKR